MVGTMAKIDDSVKKKVPELRFPGFTDDWEERKLGDIAPLRGGYAFKSSKFRNTGVPIVRISNILSSGEVGGDFAYYDEQDKDDKYILPDKSAVLAMSGATTGKVSILSQTDYDKVYQNQRVGYFQSVDYIDYGFISTIVRSELFMMQLESVLVSGAQPNVSSKEIDSFNFMIPILVQEQQKIGSFFKQLDDTIALHQRKLDLLKEQKKGYLQKMFPKNGAKVPELRFAGFADDWEDRKLSSIAERVTRKNKNNESTLPLTISAQDGLVDQNDYFNKQVASRDVTGYFLVKNGEFAYNKSYSNGYPWGAIKRLDKYEMGVLSTLYIVFKPTAINSQFLVSYYETTRWYGEVSKNAAEGARNHGLLNISPNDFFNTLLTIPKSAEEQQQIGSFFKQLDDTISLHQRKLDLLKEQKKAFYKRCLCRVYN
ncbi:restriction endonuclease subunit S [Lactococcus cremoris]|uniref:restriction endonuclease subunit S n=1 Tax=Lactococcus lactis subsp. cremoris TaxID=1359 RepID=UPI003D13DA95